MNDLDAMTVAPDHHTVLFENEQVRVLDTRVRPGERTPVHTHVWPASLYVISGSEFVRFDPEGNVLLDSRAAGVRLEPGTALFGGPLGPHWIRNVGTSELRIIATELKR